MKLFERIIKRNIRRYLNEMDVTNRRESTNVEDRRNEPINEIELKALRICQEICPKLKVLKSKGQLNGLIRNLFGGDLTRQIAEICNRLADARITNSGNPKRDYADLQEQLVGQYAKFGFNQFGLARDPLVYCLANNPSKISGISNWLIVLRDKLRAMRPNRMIR